MLPFLHLGPATLPTYGLLMATGLLVAYFVLRTDLRRRKLAVDPGAILGATALAGIIGARIYHLFETPSEFFADPVHLLFAPTGFAWFGGLLAGFVTLILLARHYRIPVLQMMDATSPAAALGYGVGRLGCLTSGDGDYGIPTSLPWGMSFPNGLVPTAERVHPTPVYEFLVAVAIFYVLWRLGEEVQVRARPVRRRQDSKTEPRSHGVVFAAFLLLTGAARFLVEFIRINPRFVLRLTTRLALRLTNAQWMSLVSIVAGAILLRRATRDSGSA